jgi:peroxiredoxin
LAAVVALGAASTGWAEALVGQPAPDFTLSDAGGQPHALSQHRGAHVVLEWFNNECPFVRKHYDSGHMQRLQAAYTAKGVVWLTIASSAPGKQGHVTPAQAQEVVRERQARQTALLLDPEGTVGRLYGAKTTPHMFIVGPDGALLYAGAIDDAPSADPADLAGATNYVARALDEALAGAPVSIPRTDSYGCSVKY